MENVKEDLPIMTHAQLQTELLRCEYCEEKPCKEACPANCSPFDFIMAARVGNASDIKRSAAEIMHANPLGGVCGMVCPDTLCMAACSRKKFDGSINIPQVQATIVEDGQATGRHSRILLGQTQWQEGGGRRRRAGRTGRRRRSGADGLPWISSKPASTWAG